MPTTLDVAVFDLYKSDNNQNSDLLIASPGGHCGGGGAKSKQQQNIEANQEKAKESAKRRNACKKIEVDCSKKGVESNNNEKIAISKLDTDVGVGQDSIKDETKELTAKVAIASISNISAKILN